MNILDINELPVLTMQISGREGTPTGAWVINQEKKQKIEIASGDISYIAGDRMIITLSDSSFISSIEEDTTLSVIVFNGNIPLYRDIARFSGELNSVDFYSQYNHSADYYVYGDSDESDGEGSGTVDGGDTGNGGGYTPPTSGTGSLVISDFATKYDLDNNGLGELKNMGNLTFNQHTLNVLGDFKVRTGEYGVFNDTPTSLEEVVVHSFLYDANNGNSGGWHPDFISNTPELEGTYYHFAGGQSEQASDKIVELIVKDELTLDTTGNVSVFKEDSVSDWTVGMSLYKDISGTPIMDGKSSPWDRYHFIARNSNGDWTLIRSTDNIVTHVEVAKDTDYIKFQEFFPVNLTTDPYISKPTVFSEYVSWFSTNISEPSSTVSVNTSNTAENSKRRRSFDFSNGDLISIGDNILRRAAGKNSNKVYHEDLVGLVTDEESEGTIYQYATAALTRDSVNYLLIRIDNVTGLVDDFQWYTVT
jgi:hypothetical protein